MSTDLPAAVIIAHDNPQQLHRLVAAIAPLPVFLHIDANTPDPVHRAMVTGLDLDRVRLLPRLSSGWARYEVLGAELSGYAAALSQTNAEHLILLTGSDYPLQSTARIIEVLAEHRGRSFGDLFPLPAAHWGVLRGYDRFILRQQSWRHHRLALPLPRPIPADLVPTGGSQSKILARRHAELVLRTFNERPDLHRFFRWCWAPDEVAIPSVLWSPELGGHWLAESVACPPVFHIDWGNVPGRKPHRSPRWLGCADLPILAEAARRPGVPALFARKFAPGSGAVIEQIDAGLRHQGGAAR